ncbi:MAG: hypothetical protein EHM36_02665, partial [Deltaproteobacteria bacterium]
MLPWIPFHRMKYRVFLLGIGRNTGEDKESFCRQISEEFKIPEPLLKRVVDHCPILLKKNLPRKRAESLARTLKSFGARVSVEVRRDLPPVNLEFQNSGPHQIALELSSFGRIRSGAWDVTGRARNISTDLLSDIWALIQLFDGRDEFLTFEEVPLTLNPLPPGEISPFRAVFERDLPIHRVSIAFKTSSGAPLAAVDGRPVPGWEKVEWEEGDEAVLSIDLSTSQLPMQVESLSLEPLAESSEDPDPVAVSLPGLLDEETSSCVDEGVKPDPDKIAERSPAANSAVSVEETFRIPSEAASSPISVRSEKEDPGSPAGSGFFLGEEDSKSSLFPWIEEFKRSIDLYYREHSDPFPQWFRSRRDANEFKDDDHSLLTLLACARFDQNNEPGKAVENTDRVFKLLAQPRVSLEEIPVLEGTLFFSREQWRDLFCRAIPKLQQICRSLLDKKKGEASEFQRMILVIPHMSERMSRTAVRWVRELIPQAIEIDFSNHPVFVDGDLYRVACRLGIVHPHFD